MIFSSLEAHWGRTRGGGGEVKPTPFGRPTIGSARSLRPCNSSGKNARRLLNRKPIQRKRDHRNVERWTFYVAFPAPSHNLTFPEKSREGSPPAVGASSLPAGYAATPEEKNRCDNINRYEGPGSMGGEGTETAVRGVPAIFAISAHKSDLEPLGRPPGEGGRRRQRQDGMAE